MANLGGRPTKLTDEIVEQAKEYLDNTVSIGVNAGGLLPTVERLALTIGISRETVYAWAKENEEFSDILSRLQAMQADMLMQNSLVNRYNPTIAKLLLSSKHGYIEKKETDITSKGEAITTEQNPALAADFAAYLKQKTKE